MGGMASGGMRSGDTRLFLDDRVVDTGAIGARLPGIAIRALVSQGGRPIGNVYAVTRAEGNVIHELGGRPPLQRLQELVATLPSEDRELVGRGLHVGRVIDEDCRFPCLSPFPGKTRRKRSCAAAGMRPFTGGFRRLARDAAGLRLPDSPWASAPRRASRSRPAGPSAR